MNAFTMCDHVEILDNGEYICSECGLVLGQEYVSVSTPTSSPRISPQNYNVYLNVCNILEKLYLNNTLYAIQVCESMNKYLSRCKHKEELKIGAGIFYTLSENNVSYQISKIARIVCLDKYDYKKFYKLIQYFPQTNTLHNDESQLVNLLLSNFPKKDIENITEKIQKLKCEYCSYSPITQIAGISYLYFKHCKNDKKPLKSICDLFLISPNSVYLYLKHSCVKNWILE